MNDQKEIFDILSDINTKIDSILTLGSNFNPPARSPQINELSSALSKAQAEIKIAYPSKENKYYKTKYADIADIINASREPLTKNNLAVIQQIVPNKDGQNILHTILSHESGQWIESRMRITPSKNDIQTFGSYLSSLKRYAYAAIVGVVTGDEDDDAEIATYKERKDFSEGKKLNHKYNPKEQSYETITKEQLEEIRYEIGSHTDLAEEILEKMKIQSLADLPKSKFITAIQRIREIIQLRDGK